ILRKEAVIAVIDIDREVLLLVRQICARPRVGRKSLHDAGSKVHRCAERRRLKCDRNAVSGIRRIRTWSRRKGPKPRRRRKSQWTRSRCKVGKDLRIRIHEIGKVYKTVNAWYNHTDRCEAWPQHVVPDGVHVGAKPHEVFSTDPGHGIRTLNSGLPDFVENAEVMTEQQF